MYDRSILLLRKGGEVDMETSLQEGVESFANLIFIPAIDTVIRIRLLESCLQTSSAALFER
jgi:hypothetical protein